MTPEIQTALTTGVITIVGALVALISLTLSNRGKADSLKLGVDEQRQKLDNFVLGVAQKSDARDLEFRRLEELRRTDAQEIGKITLEVGTLRSELKIADRLALERDARILFLVNQVDQVTRENTGLKQVITDLTAANERLTRQLEEIPLLQARVKKLEVENEELRKLWTSLQTKPV